MSRSQICLMDAALAKWTSTSIWPRFIVGGSGFDKSAGPAASSSCQVSCRARSSSEKVQVLARAVRTVTLTRGLTPIMCILKKVISVVDRPNDATRRDGRGRARPNRTDGICHSSNTQTVIVHSNRRRILVHEIEYMKLRVPMS